MTGKDPLHIDLAALPKDAVVADIVDSPLRALLAAAPQGQPSGRRTWHAAASGGPGILARFGVRPDVTLSTQGPCRGLLGAA